MRPPKAVSRPSVASRRGALTRPRRPARCGDGGSAPSWGPAPLRTTVELRGSVSSSPGGVLLTARPGHHFGTLGGVAMEEMEVRASIDRLSIVADDAGMKQVLSRSIVVQNQRPAPHPYKWQWDIVDGGIVQYSTGAGILPWRIDVNPSKCEGWLELLGGLKHARVTRIDIAIDYWGYDLSRVMWLTDRPRKRNWWTGSDGCLETLYIGSPRSVLRYRIYDKRREREEDDENTAAAGGEGGPVGAGGPLPPPRAGVPWWRVEAQIRDPDFVNSWPDPFYGLTAIVPKAKDWREEAIIQYLMTPGAWGRMPRNTRMRWRERLQEGAEPLCPTPSEVYQRDCSVLRRKLDTWLSMTKRLVTA